MQILYFSIDNLIDFDSVNIESINDGSLSGEDALRSRNLFAWLVLGVYVMNLIDAYVDAHLSTFPNQPDKEEVPDK